MTVADRVRVLLLLRNLDESVVAKRAGIDRQAVWKIVRGDTPNPGILTVEKIVIATGATMIEYYQLKALTMEERLGPEIRRVLLNATDGKDTAPSYLTAYQILDRLPEDIRTWLIQKRGGVGAGSGASYGPTKDIANAINKLADEIDTSYMDARGIVFKVGGQDVAPGYGLIAIYRIVPAK